jgi:hypothetical protein
VVGQAAAADHLPQSASTFANQVVAFVIPWLVLSRTGSA